MRVAFWSQAIIRLSLLFTALTQKAALAVAARYFSSFVLHGSPRRANHEGQGKIRGLRVCF
jgi:hypothetical protein